MTHDRNARADASSASEAGRGRTLAAGVAIPAAGSASRLGGRRKIFLQLHGEPVLRHTLRPFLEHPNVSSIAIALPDIDARDPPEWLEDLDERIRIVRGGATRMHSVYEALRGLDEGTEVAMVHDAARPLVTGAIIDRCLSAVEEGWGSVAGWPVVDTLKEVDATQRVLSTPSRAALWCAQTPQAFPRTALLDAYRRALEEDFGGTDDAAVFARSGGQVRMVRGASSNLKVTHPEDVAMAEFLLRSVAGRVAG